MKSSLKNMIVVLATICLVTSAVLGVVFKLTEEPIKQAERNNLVAALSAVLPEFDNDPLETQQSVVVNDGEESTTTVYTAQMGSEVAGYAITSSSLGFGGEIQLMTGFDAAGKIVNISVLSMSETPGLGANMTNEDNVLLASFRNKDAANLNMTVKKDGGDVDALTASTISSRAYAKAVRRAYEAYLKVSGNVAVSTAVNAPAEGEGGENE